MPGIPGVDALAKLATKQGAAAAVAIALAATLSYFTKMQSDTMKLQALATRALAAQVDALGDLVVSSCQPDHVAIRAYLDAKIKAADLESK